MLPRTSRCVLTVVLALSMALLPARTAWAHDTEVPFTMRFPQETGVTTFGSSFGALRLGGRRHEGVDLMAPKMTEVYVIANGVITTVGDSPRAGRYLIVDHDGGWSSYYVHLNNDNLGTDDGRADWSLTIAPGVEVGAKVEAGQLLGWVGDSGNAEGTGPHTHFELHRDGHAVDPYPHLLEAWVRDHDAMLSRQQRLEMELDPSQIE